MSEIITLAHGSGGKLTSELIKALFLKKFTNSVLNKMEDSAVIKKSNFKIAFTTDSYVVDPIFFPGGDIGRLAVCGTVNDISVSGAKPLVISCAFIIEEGFEMSQLKKIVDSMKKAAEEANVEIVTGDTKVVEKSKADKLFITTSGIGIFDSNVDFSYGKVKNGDVIIVNGEIASHGITVLNERNNLGIKGNFKSDVAPLNDLIARIKNIKGIRCIKDLTRGGLATGLNEIAESANLMPVIDEDLIPVQPAVRNACEILGIDPLYVANEGKIVVIAESKSADKIISIMKKHKYGKKSVIIGHFEKGNPVLKVKTRIGSYRLAPLISGEQLPRIC